MIGSSRVMKDEASQLAITMRDRLILANSFAKPPDAFRAEAMVRSDRCFIMPTDPANKQSRSPSCNIYILSKNRCPLSLS